MISRFVTALFLITGLVSSEAALPKGTTVQLSITGPNLPRPVHSSDHALIAASVWGGNFANWNAGQAPAPDQNSPQYLVHFWVEFAPGDVHMKYVIRYQWDDDAQHAVICLPGRRDPWYTINVYSISREGKDGKCFYADDSWGRAVHAAVTRTIGTD